MRFRDILTNTRLWSKLAVIIDESHNKWLRDLGKNDFVHSRSIESILDRLVPDNIKQDEKYFDHGEIFILLASVYLHDIGRHSDSLHHEIEAYEDIRTNFLKYYLNEFEGEAIAQVCAAHASEEVWPISSCNPSFGISGMSSAGRTFNLQRMGALLRLADELDNTFKRVSGIRNQSSSIRNCIRDVNPVYEKGIIELQCNPSSWIEWSSLNKVRIYTENRLKQIKYYLDELNLNYYQIWLSPSTFSAPIKIDTNTIVSDDVIEHVALLLEKKYDTVEVYKILRDVNIDILCRSYSFSYSVYGGFVITRSLNDYNYTEYYEALSFLIDVKDIHYGVIISLSDYRLSSDNDSEYIRTMAYHEFLYELFAFDQLLKHYIDNYKKYDIFKKSLYVNLSGTHETGDEICNLELFIKEWITDGDSIHLTILGDYGSGKTTFLNKLTYDLSLSCLDNKNNRIPILIDLKTIDNNTSIESLITNYLVNNFDIDINYNIFDVLNKSGAFIILLDGFDEIGKLNNEMMMIKAFRQLDTLVNEKSKVILTCRTHYFKDRNHIHTLYHGSRLYDSVSDKYGYKLVFISPFSEDQIEDYLRKWDEKGYSKYVKIINDIYNLKDLAKRPVLLNMLANTVPQIAKLRHNNYDTIDAVDIYEQYINYWLDRDDWRSELSVRDRSEIANSIAIHLLVNNKKSVHFSEIHDLLPDWCKVQVDMHGTDVVDVECRTCNMLTSDKDGNYSFAHKSFQEYLIAYDYCRVLFSSNNMKQIRYKMLFEEEYIRSKKIISTSKESEEFFMAISCKKMSLHSHEELTSFIKDSSRKMRAVYNIIEYNKLYAYTGLLVPLFIYDKSIFKLNTLLELFLKSLSLDDDLLKFKPYITEDNDLKRIDLILNTVEQEIDYPLSSLQVLRKQLKRIKSNLQDDIHYYDESHVSYPYSKENRKIELESILRNINDDAEKQQLKKRFTAKWNREKSEYDQKMRVEKKRRDIEEYEVIELKLKESRK